MIVINNINKKYKDNYAIKDFSLEIESGQVFGLLGPNGAGKSTLIKILSGVINDYTGNIEINNLELKKQVNTSKFKQYIGVVPQDNILFEKLTGRENLETFCVFQNIKKEKRRKLINELLAEVDLTDKADSIVSSYSGGMKRRLSIALALVSDPMLLFLDEPSSGLDPEIRRDIWSLIQKLKARGITVLVSTHYMDEAEKISDNIGIMYHGRLVAQGTVEEIKELIDSKENISLEDAYLSLTAMKEDEMAC